MINYTIIIPHKNTPDLLAYCLSTIPMQDDVQVIVVDDNSYPQKVDFGNFPQWGGRNYEYYLTKEGKGAGYARNVGLERAKGKWVLFVNAAAWLMNVEMIKEVGGFDTLLFKHYGEDENLCQRIRYFGWKIEIDSSTTICHDRFKRVQNCNYKEGALGQHAYEIEAKASMGDITKDVHIIYHIVRQFILTIVWYLLLNPERATIHKNLIYSYCLARKSRKINKRGGLLWL